MNCLDVRRLLWTNLVSGDAQLRQHLTTCPGCTQFAAELARQDAIVQQALNVPVPPHLAERILLTTRPHRARRSGYAIAASVLLAVTLGVISQLGGLRSASPDWSEVVLAHVLNERDTLASTERIPLDTLKSELQRFGLAVQGDPGTVRFLGRCDMPGGKGLHVVLDTPERGLLTLIIPPGDADSDADHSARDGLSSRLLALNGRAVGLVLPESQSMDEVSEWLGSVLHSV
jgi:hypothetical protein